MRHPFCKFCERLHHSGYLRNDIGMNPGWVKILAHDHYPLNLGYRAVRGYVHAFVNHTQKEYARGDVHENRAECLFSLLKPYLRVFRGISKTNLLGYLGFFQFLRNFHQLTAFEQAELILHAALNPAIASRAKKGDFVKCLDHFDLLQTAIN